MFDAGTRCTERPYGNQYAKHSALCSRSADTQSPQASENSPALGRKVAPLAEWNPSTVRESSNQRPFNALSVFNFYPPNHRTQGTNVLAPEQKMLNSVEFSDRMNTLTYSFQDDSLLSNAGCDVEPFKAAQAVSDEKLLDLINDRYFRGVLPAAISKSLIDANKNYSNRNKGLALTGAILDMASITSAYGVSK